MSGGDVKISQKFLSASRSPNINFLENSFNPQILVHDSITFEANLYLCWSVPLKRGAK